MDLLNAMMSRSSVRAFLDEPIPRDLIEFVLKSASRAPSALNLQPWELHVVMGSERKRLSKKLLRSYRERGITCGPGTSKPLPDKFMARARKCADDMKPLVKRMGLEFKEFVNEGSLSFYGAPCVVFIFLDESFPPERMLDAGTFIAYFVLASHACGLGSCPIGLASSYSDDIGDFINVPDSKKLVISIALGKPDLTQPINDFRTERADPLEFVRWID